MDMHVEEWKGRVRPKKRRIKCVKNEMNEGTAALRDLRNNRYCADPK